ncbi:MAG: amino acid racemase [Desulfurococcales archaeon]|nr:amino acid racemase [Desulfurococcales archaeon]
MKIGLIGGLSPYSTILYYKEIVELAKKRYGSYLEIVINSVSLEKVQHYVRNGDLEGLSQYLGEAAQQLEEAGAKIIGIAANTPHIVAPRVSKYLREAELISIVDAVAEKIRELGVSKVGLLATRATINYRLYHNALEPLGIKVITPLTFEQKVVDEVIDNLTKGLIDTRAKLRLSPIITGLVGRGARAIVLGCTELPLVFGGFRIKLPVVDSVRVHVEALLERAEEILRKS